MKLRSRVITRYISCLALVNLISSPQIICATELSYLQQLSRFWSRTLGEVLGFASLILRTSNPPTTVEIIRRNGYPVETHYTVTSDNVVLEIHRVPHGPMLELFRLNRRIPVLLMHGIAQSSSDWFLNSPLKDSLGFFLSNEGYDVWVGNFRGNLNKNSGHGAVSWNYSFHEMGVHDLPAIINYVAENTGFQKIHYVGFSMGNTALMTALSKHPSLNSRIKIGVILGPSIFHDNFFNGWLKLIAPFAWPLEVIQNQFASIPLLPPLLARTLHKILPVICHPKIDLVGLCLVITNMMFGYDHGQITKEKLALVTQVSPTPITSKLMLHYLQELGSGRFSEYDYGLEKNLQVYGRKTPPDYNLTNIIAPMSVLVGQEDLLAHRQDAMTLANKLPNLVDFYFVPFQHFNHIDFCYAEDVGLLVYNHVLKILKRFD